MSNDLFGRSPEQEADSRHMNSMIVAGAERGKSYGTLGATGRPTSSGDAMREKLSGALDELEHQQRRGDEDAVAFAEHVLDRVISESRQARNEQLRDPDTGQFVEQPSSDGGVRGRRQFHPGSRQESANSMMLAAMQRSRQERDEAGEEHDLIVANI